MKANPAAAALLAPSSPPLTLPDSPALAAYLSALQVERVAALALVRALAVETSPARAARAVAVAERLCLRAVSSSGSLPPSACFDAPRAVRDLAGAAGVDLSA